MHLHPNRSSYNASCGNKINKHNLICCYKCQIYDENYMIRNKAKSDMDWNTLKNSPTLHRILWIQRLETYNSYDFKCIIVGSLYPMDYDEVVNGFHVHS